MERVPSGGTFITYRHGPEFAVPLCRHFLKCALRTYWRRPRQFTSASSARPFRSWTARKAPGTRCGAMPVGTRVACVARRGCAILLPLHVEQVPPHGSRWPPEE